MDLHVQQFLIDQIVFAERFLSNTNFVIETEKWKWSYDKELDFLRPLIHLVTAIVWNDVGLMLHVWFVKFQNSSSGALQCAIERALCVLSCWYFRIETHVFLNA